EWSRDLPQTHLTWQSPSLAELAALLGGDQFGRQRRQPVVLTLRPAILDRHVLTLDLAGSPQTFAKRDHVRRIPLRRCAIEEPDHRHRLLRARRERPRRRAAEQRYEVAPPS